MAVRIRRVVKAVDITLAREQLDAAVAAATATHGIARTIAENVAMPLPASDTLRGLHEARAIGHFAEVPAFAEQDDVLAARGIGGAPARPPWRHAADGP